MDASPNNWDHEVRGTPITHGYWPQCLRASLAKKQWRRRAKAPNTYDPHGAPANACPCAWRSRRRTCAYRGRQARATGWRRGQKQVRGELGFRRRWFIWWLWRIGRHTSNVRRYADARSSGSDTDASATPSGSCTRREQHALDAEPQRAAAVPAGRWEGGAERLEGGLWRGGGGGREEEWCGWRQGAWGGGEGRVRGRWCDPRQGTSSSGLSFALDFFPLALAASA